MASKRTAFMYNLFTVIVLFSTVFACTDYPVGMISYDQSVAEVVRRIAVNIVILILVYAFFLCIISRGKHIFDRDAGFVLFAEIKPIIKKATFLLGLQFVCDIVYYRFGVFAGEGMMVVQDALGIVMWGALFWIMCKNNGNAPTNKKKFFVVLAVIFVVVFVCDVYLINILKQADQKFIFVLFGGHARTISQNCSFIHSLVRLGADIVVSIVMVWMFTFGICEEKTSSGCDKRENVALSFTRCLALLILSYALFFVLSLAGGNNIGTVISHSNVSSDVYDDSFDCEINEITIVRGTEPVYTCFKSEVFRYDSETQKKIHFAEIGLAKYGNTHNYEKKSDSFERADNFKEYTVDNGEKAYLFRNCAICFTADGKPQAIELSEINKTKENSFVTTVLEKMLEEGNVTAYIYGSEYLKKYDKDFVSPYTERFSAGDFTDTETLWAMTYQFDKNYISEIAKK